MKAARLFPILGRNAPLLFQSLETTAASFSRTALPDRLKGLLKDSGRASPTFVLVLVVVLALENPRKSRTKDEYDSEKRAAAE
jgi:hypothetical protein